VTVRTVATPHGTVTIEAFAHVIRYHEVGEYGDPYTFACAMTTHGDEATLFAALGTVKPRIRRALAQALREMGIARVRYERRNAGGPREIEVDR